MKIIIFVFALIICRSFSASGSGVIFTALPPVINSLTNTYVPYFPPIILQRPRVAGDNKTISYANVSNVAVNASNVSVQLGTGEATFSISTFDLTGTYVPNDTSKGSFNFTSPNSNLSFVVKLSDADEGLWFYISGMKLTLPNFEVINNTGGFLSAEPDSKQIGKDMLPLLTKWFTFRVAASFNSFRPYQIFDLPITNHTFLVNYTADGNPTIAPDHVTIPTVGVVHLPGYTFNLPSTILFPAFNPNSTAGLQFFYSAFTINSAVFSGWIESYYFGLVNATNTSVTSANLTSMPVINYENETVTVNLPGILPINGSNPDLQLTCANQILVWTITRNESRWTGNGSVTCTLDYWNNSTSNWTQAANMTANANVTLNFSVMDNNALQIVTAYVGATNFYDYSPGLNQTNVAAQVDQLFGALFKNTPISIPLPILPGLKLVNPTVSVHDGYIEVNADTQPVPV